LAGVQVAKGLVELGEQVEAGLGDLDHDDAAVVLDAATFGEAGVDETIDEARDVGDVGDELLADCLAGDPARGGAGLVMAAEDAEGVVGGFAQAVDAEEAVELGAEARGGAVDVEIGLLLRRLEGVLLADLLGEGAGGVG
jgi:hypothetical protein